MKRFLFFLLVACVAQGALLPFLKTPRHDGIKRVCTLTANNFTTVVTAADTAIIIFVYPTTSKPPCPTELDTFAEVTAQVLRKKNSIVCEASPDLIVGTQGTGTAVKDGDVYIYKKGRGVPYYGKRSTRALLNHLFKVNGTEVNMITGKVEKIAFDAVENVKVVGFFTQGTPEYQAFQEAASVLSPSVSFYAAFDRLVAQHLKLFTVGQIHLVKPFSKIPLPCPINPASAADIELFVKTNSDSLLSKIDENNMYDPSLLDPSKILVLAVADKASPAGGYFYHLIMKLVRNIANNTAFSKLNIVWVEPQIFPIIHLVMDELETTLGIPKRLPAFGAIHVTTLQSSWLDTNLLNCSGDKFAESQSLQVLQQFLMGVVTNTVVPVKLGVQSFVQAPTAQTVVENSDVVLECVIENPVGDCLWLKDGKNIGYNLDRYQHYSWRGDRLTGDCSLVIKGVKLDRDNGEWICETTGDENNPTMSSPPVKLLITAADSATLETVKAEL